MGSMNFGLYPMLDRFSEFEHTWERDNLEKSRDLVFKNTFQDIETILKIGKSNETRFEFECSKKSSRLSKVFLIFTKTSSSKQSLKELQCSSNKAIKSIFSTSYSYE